MNKTTRAKQRPRSTWHGPIIVATYCAAVAGVNLPNPLAPVSAAQYGFGAATQAGLFSLYLGALVVGLVLIPRFVRITSTSALVLTIGGACISIVASLALAASAVDLAGLFTARALGGAGLALSTGGAATLAVAVAGEKGRASVGVGAVAGSLVGNAGGAVLADLLPSPMLLIPLIHVGTTALLAIAMLAIWRTVGTNGAAKAIGPRFKYTPRHRIAGYLLGAMSWTASGTVLALAPTAVREATGNESLILATAPGALLLVTGFAGQMLVRNYLTHIRAWMVSIPLAFGMITFGVSLLEGSVAGLLFAGAITGLGQGPAYTLGLVTVTHRLPPNVQGLITSRFSAIAYAACGVVVLLAGVAADAFGVAEAFLLVGAVIGVGATVSTALAGARQRAYLAPALNLAR